MKKFNEFVNKYGTFTIIKNTFLLMFVAYGFYFSLNPKTFFEKYTTYVEEKHSESFNYRMENTPAIQTTLDKFVLEVGAERGVIVELHNGKSNSAGLSFNYATITYESDQNDTTENIMEDYTDASLDRFPMATKVYCEGYWEGSTIDLRKFDKKLALRLESNNTYYAAGSVIYGSKDEIGFLVASFNDKKDCKVKNLKNTMIKYAAKLSPFLDGKDIKKKD